MFTPKNIQGALEELYDLCDPDYMVDMLVNYSEEFDDISPALLAKSFQKNAEMISEYRVLSSAGEGNQEWKAERSGAAEEVQGNCRSDSEEGSREETGAWSVMDKRKMKKLLILNLPYFLVGLFATNLYMIVKLNMQEAEWNRNLAW